MVNRIRLNHSHQEQKEHPQNDYFMGAWVAQSVKHLPSGQVMILESWDQALGQAPCSVGSLLLPLPLLLHTFSLSLSNK